MDKNAACLLSLSPVLLAACAMDTGHPKIYRNTDPAFVEKVAELPVRVQTVRASYGVDVLMPPRYAPHYFCAQQRRAAERLSPAAKADYVRFCMQSTYPHTLDTWCDETALSGHGDKRVIISLSDQRGVFLVDGCIALDFPVCSGSRMRPTPTGSYTVLQKDANHHSNLYDNAPMLCFMRLTWDGVGMHIGPMEGSPASHGCIRMPAEACRRLFARVRIGTPVLVLP